MLLLLAGLVWSLQGAASMPGLGETPDTALLLLQRHR